MSDLKQVSDEFSAGGQPTPEALKNLAAEGFKTIVNLRSSHEAGVLSDEQEQAEAAGLEYVHVPLSSTEPDQALVGKVLSELTGLPTPVFFHCGAGARADALALIAYVTQQALSKEEALQKAKELGIKPNQPHLKDFLETLP